MRIAQLAPPLERVPPLTYGGTERVISLLTEELVQRGHVVSLFAPGDSLTSAHLVPTVDRALWHTGEANCDVTPFLAVALGKLAARVHEFDLVHNHLDYLAYPLSRLAPCPVVTTPHGRLDLSGYAALYREFADVPLVSISDAQRLPIPHANWLGTVYNAVQLDQLTLGNGSGGYLAYLGRISPDKGLDTAIRVARRAGLNLKVAARLPLSYRGDPNAQADWAYFNDLVRPLLDGREVEFIGELEHRERNDFLGQAAGLLFPINWPEPFGLVMAEALACGTPVVALRAGSVPEVIDHGLTGFICDDEDGLVSGVGHLAEIDRAHCRVEAERRFSPSVMASAYEHLYAQLLTGYARSRVDGRVADGVAGPLSGLVERAH